jgi:hypothetical protein
MLIPGSNLYSIAQTLIGDTELLQYQPLSRELNRVGQWIVEYSDPVSIRGSWQPVERNLYHEIGLDLSQTAYLLYVSADIIDVQRDRSNDLIVWGDKTFACNSSVPDYFEVDGWVGMLCVLIDGPSDPLKNKKSKMVNVLKSQPMLGSFSGIMKYVR